jgi:N-methylhydantoinase A/oxoprolinase/acetone carboxylase beta subunit
MPFALGIDTGGTYTDAVLVDYETGHVLAKAKAPTTKHDLAIGIGEAMRRVASVGCDIGLVSLSTTLATNALVEGNGAPVCALLIGYGDELADAELERELNTRRIVRVGGGHSTSGEELAPFDARAARDAILEHAPHVAAFAISGYFGTRNPEHELAAKQLVQRLTDLPCTCGHELTHRLNALRRATTVALNASLIPLICELIEAVERTCGEQGIRAPLMVVKGDGSLMSAEVAKERPIETILSGPAASVVGAQHLAASPDAVVVDMGGTTTDIAVLRDGRPLLNSEGASVGPWRTMVEAIDVQTVGLGGDSRVWLDEARELCIGPRRVVPLCMLAASYGDIAARLRRQFEQNGAQGEFFVALRRDWNHDGEAPAFAAELRERLLHEPLTLAQIHEMSRYPQLYARYLERLEREGAIIRSGLTPTDAAHALGLYQAWDPEPSRVAVELMARRLGWEAHALSTAVVQRTAERMAEEIALKLVRDQQGDHHDLAAPRALIRRLLRAAPEDRLTGRLALRATLTAIGAPVATYFPRVAQSLNAPLCVPEHAEVANAIGAVVGSVVSRVHISIAPQALDTALRVYLPDRTVDMPTLAEAVALAESEGRALALERALRSGAQEVRVHVVRRDQTAPVGQGWGDELFVQTVLDITATGRPRALAAMERLVP